PPAPHPAAAPRGPRDPRGGHLGVRVPRHHVPRRKGPQGYGEREPPRRARYPRHLARAPGGGRGMNALAIARIPVRALRVNKLRSILTMLGIIIGVAAVIAMVSVGSGAQARVAEQIQSLGSNLIIVLSGSVSQGGIRLGQGTQLTISEDDGYAIQREIPAVQGGAP